jgi:hypothetical protein
MNEYAEMSRNIIGLFTAETFRMKDWSDDRQLAQAPCLKLSEIFHLILLGNHKT